MSMGSRSLFTLARRHIAGGVNSPSRSFAAVGGGDPVFMAHGEGPYMWDTDGHRYIDYLSSFGALILGHAHPDIVHAVQAAAARGTVFGTPTEAEVTFAARLKAAIPFLDLVRFTVSGTEAVMTALRLARAHTDRAKILKFSGSYHGHSDPVLVAAGSGSSTLGIDDSLGLTAGTKSDVVSVPYNDSTALKEAVDRWGDDLACMLVEPVVGNFGIVTPADGFLETVSRQARRCGALVIWDEVITAFRFGYGSVASRFEVVPDLVTLGKIIGGGLPMGAYGGRADVMRQMAPLGAVYQDGTLAGNPLSLAAGSACLEALARADGLYERLEAYATRLQACLVEAASACSIPLQVNRFGGALSVHFTDQPVRDFAGCETGDQAAFGRFFRALLREGVCIAPSHYEAWFVSAAHTDRDIAQTEEAIGRALRAVAAGPR